ncbi:MAG: hypothetical protein K0U38_10580 [Epsilonproteobacteria bacterium]|nr:hypothetical protein [Campylobacterota bacterium]
MKKTILLSVSLLLLTACTNTISNVQKTESVAEVSTEMSSLKHALSDYTDATIKNDINKLITFVYPKVFTLMTKERMTVLLEEMHASGKAPKIVKINHKDISAIHKYDAGSYAIITSAMEMELKSPAVNNPKYETIVLDMLKKRMGEDAEVHLDKDKHLFFVKKDSKIIGIKEGAESWKFVGYDQAKRYASKNIIPSSISQSLQ